MIRSVLFSIMLALVKCQSICKLDLYEEYSDPKCTQAIQRTPEWMYPEVVDRVNQVIVEGGCQVWNETMNPAPKIKITCLTSEAVKIEQFNHQNEDPECKFPYPSYASIPSYVAKTGDCVQVGPKGYAKFFISSTTGRFEQTDNSWEIPDVNKQVDADAGDKTEEAVSDRTDEATSCMISELEVFGDAECKNEIELPPMFKDYLLYQGNQEIMSPECVYTNKVTMKGNKARAYCHSEDTYSLMNYNFYDEDPLCLRPYPDNAVNFTSFKTKSGECVRSGATWIRLKIEKNDYRAWEWNPEWDQLLKGPGADDHQDKEKGKAQSFSMNGDDYSVSIKMEDDTLMTEMKFDEYFMYGIDHMGEEGATPPCGPDAEYDMCKEKVFSQDTCCSHVVMMDDDGNQKNSFYRCMNQNVVDASFSISIDGMKMSMACSGDKMSAATYVRGLAILASLISLFAISGF